MYDAFVWSVVQIVNRFKLNVLWLDEMITIHANLAGPAHAEQPTDRRRDSVHEMMKAMKTMKGVKTNIELIIININHTCRHDQTIYTSTSKQLEHLKCVK